MGDQAVKQRPQPGRARPDLLTDTEIACGVRRVSVTHDGRKIGHVEKLNRDDPNVKRVFALARLAKGRAALAAKHETLSGKIQQAQKQSATKRAKGKR